jgi:hypothetical protein
MWTWPVVSLADARWDLGETVPWRQAFFVFFSGASVRVCLALAVLCVAYPIASNMVPAFAFVGVGVLLVAVALERSDKKRAASQRHTEIA